MDAIKRAITLKQLRSLPGPSMLLVGALIVILALGTTLRFYGQGWDEGYPYTPHPDERAILGHVADLRFPQADTFLDSEQSLWNPKWFPYGSFPLYALKVAQSGLATIQGGNPADLRALARTISALADMGTVLIVFLLAGRVYGRREALLSSFLVAIAVIHIQLSHFFTVDTILALITVSALFFMHRIAKKGRLIDSVLAGIFIGIGLATKFSQLPIYATLVVAHGLYFVWPTGQARTVVERLKIVARGLLAGCGASILALVITQPYGFLDWSNFYADVNEQAEMVRRIRDYPYTRQYIDTTPYWYQIRQLSTWGLGLPLGVASWAGLVYAGLRGMKLKTGLGYLAVGWLVPVTILILSTSVAAIVAAVAIALTALVGTMACRHQKARTEILLLSWVAPYLLITCAFEVKFMRYMLPVTPVMILLAARMLIAGWDQTKRQTQSLRWLVGVGILLVVGATTFYALSYMAVYSSDHTAVRTSSWLNNNANPGDVILMEHWEEGLPNLGQFNLLTLSLYDDDSNEKLASLSKDLSRGDYVVFFSNRLYGTIPRLPQRYPATTEYYKLLFSGSLGYELVNVETAYPGLLGIGIVDDTLKRPGLSSAADVGSLGPWKTTINLGFADESFSVYDHPKGMVFKNVRQLGAEELQQRISRAAGGEVVRKDQGIGISRLLFSEEETIQRQDGGTWADIVSEDSWAHRNPVLAWLLLVELIGLGALPLTFVLFRSLPDRGVILAKTLGLMIVGLVSWLLASLGWVAFSRGSVLLSAAIMIGGSSVFLGLYGRLMWQFVLRRWRHILFAEVLFLVAFGCFVLVRMANPDLWHSWLGGEKPMDMAYLNAVLRSEYMPPYDPWFAGGLLNYYYWGQYLTATLIKVTGIAPATSYNLAVPLFFALAVGGAYTLSYNLAASLRTGASPLIAGLYGVAFVTLIGNLDGAIQIVEGIYRVVFLDQPFGNFDFWRSTRMMAPGTEITEFPFFTFLFADLHAHLLALPYTLLTLALALSLVMGAKEKPWSGVEVLRLVALGISVGALRVINTWDYPTYLLVALMACFLGSYFRHGGIGLKVVVESGLKAAMVFLIGYGVFLPYHDRYEIFFTSIEWTTNQTDAWRFLAIMGLFLFVITSFYLKESKGWYVPAAKRFILALFYPKSTRRYSIHAERLSAAVIVAGMLALAVVGIRYLSYGLGSTILLLLPVLAAVSVVGIRTLVTFRPGAPQLAFISGIVALALILTIGVDIFRVEGDIDRMNTVFKFYLQAWVLMALVSAHLLWRLTGENTRFVLALSRSSQAWLGVLLLLLAGSLVYTALGTRARLAVRFDTDIPLTLDGTAYMRGAVYPDPNGPLSLAEDFEGIKWLQQNVKGSPVVLEGQASLYRWGGRISTYTGLPTVVGWQWHQEQQRWGYRAAVYQRIRDVDKIYNTNNMKEARSLLDRYDVRYVYVGPLERLYYNLGGLQKFEDGQVEGVEVVFSYKDVTILEVKPVAEN